MENKKYDCCFCNEIITSNNIDITSLIVIDNWDKSDEVQHEQQIFCHMECLKKHLSIMLNCMLRIWLNEIWNEVIKKK